MKLLLVLFCGITGHFFLSVAAKAASFEQEISLNPGLNDDVGSSIDIKDADKKKFECPFPFGSFSDPDDCHYYHICIGGVSGRKKCSKNYKFCILRRTCLPGIIAVCIDKDKKTTTTSKPTGTPSEGKFSCPRFSGSFPHPEDCSKYYTCTFYIASVKTCPKNELFDVVQSSCKSADKVHCGDRQRPGTTSVDITDSTTTETEIITDESTTETTTVTTSEPPVTPPKEITTSEPPVTPLKEITTSEPPVTPPKEITTTEKQRETAPPETDCKEDDVDCIIVETGDPDDWFKCPKDIGSYPHPSSNKLFIFCKNSIPSVKKCGMDLIFSIDLSTCIKVNFLTQLRNIKF